MTHKPPQGIDAGLRERCKANPTADPPQDCDFPFCGCFALATKTIETLQECGWGVLAPPDPRKDLALETLETIANAEWMVNSCAQELAKQALAEMRGAKR